MQPSALLYTDILLVSTLNGTLFAVHQVSGDVLWSIRNDPILQIPLKPGKKSVFLANPKDGSLYLFKLGHEGLRKLPYTIADLVSLSPRRTKDGYFYTGYKKDTWVSLDVLTGRKQHEMSKEGLHDICPTISATSIYVARTEYSIVMFEEESRLVSWNITFSDFSSHVHTPSPHLLQHFASSSSGHLVTLEPSTGHTKWTRDFESPVVGMYSLDTDLNLASRPFHTVAVETLKRLDHLGGLKLVDELMRLYEESAGLNGSGSRSSLKATLYIGRHLSSVYALPSYVHSGAVAIAPQGYGMPLLEGSRNHITQDTNDNKESNNNNNNRKESNNNNNNNKKESNNNNNNIPTNSNDSNLKDVHTKDNDTAYNNNSSGVFLIGHHEVPDMSTDTEMVPVRQIAYSQPISIKQIAAVSFDSLAKVNSSQSNVMNKEAIMGMDVEWRVVIGSILLVFVLIYSLHHMLQLYRVDSEFPFMAFKEAFNKEKVNKDNNRKNSCNTAANKRRSHKRGADVGPARKGAGGGSKQHTDSTFSIGKISYDPSLTLGHGANGTIVYRGTFDGRAVAVKRLLSAYTGVAMQEVLVLKQTDDHANVVRYFCQEQDHQFIYIALELCPCTLHDVIKTASPFLLLHQLSFLNKGKLQPVLGEAKEGVLRHGERGVLGEGERGVLGEGERGVLGEGERKVLGDVSGEGLEKRVLLDHKDILTQMLQGIRHLHSLHIIHRDVKPQNVLLSYADQGGKVRTMISDFGFCKKISQGRLSVSKTSGIAGTEGWMAPELLSSNCNKTTQAVDSFSSGCVIFYVLSHGEHPFGPPITCQSNIMQGRHNVDLLNCPDDKAAKQLVRSLICEQSSQRLSIGASLKHPFFWNNSIRLSFFEAVSDWLELLPDNHENVVRLECQGLKVIHFDWTSHLTPLLLQELVKFRYYNKNSVRDLLRAIRNKRHHFHTLSADLKATLGSPPDAFTDYFLHRFPSLLIHTYQAMHCFRHHHNLAPYY